MVVGVLTTLVLFSGGPIGSVSFAQQQTTSPGFRIEWLNPDENHGGPPANTPVSTSNEISARDDDPGAATSESYHLVAWVNALPQNYGVTFQYQSGSNAPVTIGQATLVGADTFEFNWPSTAMPADGDYTLIAILTSNGTEVSRDTENSVVNNTPASSSPPSDPRADQGQTVEIVDPTNADGLGFYDPPGDARYRAGLIVRHSAGATILNGYYSITAPGTDPDWVSCGANNTATDAADGVRCELAAGTNPDQVTAVAVVASDQPIPSPAPADRDSGDAHRVTGYIASPTSVQIAQSGSPAPGSCTSVITATVRDQSGNHVVGVNVDVHAQGPDDTLAFDDNDGSNNSTSASKAPENHPTEAARDCETTPPPASGSATQGFHDASPSDRKHIESAADGSGDNGTFNFRLYSTNAGGTQYTVWADTDNNDRLCASEPQGDGSVGWGGAAPAITGMPDEDATCVAQTGTSTTTATATSTSTSSPTPTQSTATSSPTQTSSPSPTTTTPPPPVRHGTTTTMKNYDGNSFDGKVKSGEARCRKGRTVVLKKQKSGNDKKVGTDKTNNEGNYSITEKNAKGKYYTVAKPKQFRTNDGQLVTCEKDRSPTKEA